MDLADWIGRTESRSDTVTLAPVAALSATLDRDDPAPRPGDPLPLLWHWLYFLPRHRESELDVDGHARRGEFLPPVGLARRMYAGGRVEAHSSLRVGDRIERVSRIVDVTRKGGRSEIERWFCVRCGVAPYIVHCSRGSYSGRSW